MRWGGGEVSSNDPVQLREEFHWLISGGISIREMHTVYSTDITKVCRGGRKIFGGDREKQWTARLYVSDKTWSTGIGHETQKKSSAKGAKVSP